MKMADQTVMINGMENAVEYIVQMVFFGIDHFLRTLYIKADGCEIGSQVTQMCWQPGIDRHNS